MAPARTSAAATTLTLVLAANYIAWRWLLSVNWAGWPIAVPLLSRGLAAPSTHCCSGRRCGGSRRRGPLSPPPDGATVDVFIANCNEPVEMVMTTAPPAKAMRYPPECSTTARTGMCEAAEAAGICYSTRKEDWKDRPRRAKAGNLDSALLRDVQRHVILDAD